MFYKHIRFILGLFCLTLTRNFVPLLHQEWKEKLLSSTAVAGERFGGNKLRTYKTFKHEFMTEPYVCIVAQTKYRSADDKFRCGVAPIKIETSRYGVNRVPPVARSLAY